MIGKRKKKDGRIQLCWGEKGKKGRPFSVPRSRKKRGTEKKGEEGLIVPLIEKKRGRNLLKSRLDSAEPGEKKNPCAIARGFASSEVRKKKKKKCPSWSRIAKHQNLLPQVRGRGEERGGKKRGRQ